MMGGGPGNIAFSTSSSYINDGPMHATDTVNVNAGDNIQLGSHNSIKGHDEFLVAQHDIILDGSNDIEHIALWHAGHSLYVSGDIDIDEALFIVAHTVHFDDVDLHAQHIYMLEGTKVYYTSDAHVSTAIEYISIEQMQTSIDDYMA